MQRNPETENNESCASTLPMNGQSIHVEGGHTIGIAREKRGRKRKETAAFFGMPKDGPWCNGPDPHRMSNGERDRRSKETQPQEPEVGM